MYISQYTLAWGLMGWFCCRVPSDMSGVLSGPREYRTLKFEKCHLTQHVIKLNGLSVAMVKDGMIHFNF